MLRAKLFVLMLALLVAGAAQADIIINEIMQNPSMVSDSDGEWFEVYNSGASDVDMDGWTVEDLTNAAETFVVSGTAVVPAGGYFVFGVNGDFATNGGVNVDYVYPNTFYIGNGADEIVLWDAGMTEMDRVEYDGGTIWPDPNGASMQLIDPNLDNNDGTNWAEANLPYGDGDFGTPGAMNEWADPPALVINEIMQNPAAVGDNDGEYVELYNPGNFDVDLDGYTLADLDSDSHVITGTVIVPAGGYAVLGINSDFSLNGGVPVDYQYSGFFLSNSADEVYLYDTGMNVVDGVSYDGGTIWPDPTGASMQLTDWTLDNDDGTNWLEADIAYGDGDFGTPGALNEWAPSFVTVWDTLDVAVADIQMDPYAFIDPDTSLGGDTLTYHYVRVNAIVTQGHDTIHDYYVDVFVQDDSEYGIMMYSSDTLNGEGLARGDEVEVIGIIEQYFDTTELVDFSWTELSTGNPLPDPMTFDTGDFDVDALPYEGTWCELTGEITSEPNLPGDFNFTINDGSGDGTIRIYGAAGFDMSQYAIGDQITVRGTIDTFNSLCQLQPSEIGDIEMVQTGPVTLDLTVTTDTVPATGGNIYYDAHLVSTLAGSYPVRYTSSVLAPNNNTYPIDNIPFTLTPFMNATFTGLSVSVPAAAPAGTYTFTGQVGAGPYQFPDSFDFFKTGAVDGILNPEDFVGIDALIASDDETLVQLPTEYSVETAYPNPFNPTTTLAVNLPETAELTVTVYNITGQQVATLVNGQVNAGSHNFVFNAEHLSSGLYFIQAQVPGQLNEIQKVTLMK
ncbi:lamin tail domain-containing protein [bacterium]|nr:lamin tail domain-containing protein [bacterium]